MKGKYLMPDAKKLLKIEEIGLRCVETCASCDHRIPKGKVEPHWGNCSLHSYTHLKHGLRQMPSHSLMVCDDYERTYFAGTHIDLSTYIPWKGERLTRAELFDAIDGLQAWDIGCSNSGTRDELLRVKVEDHLASLEEGDFENLYQAFVVDRYPLDDGYYDKDWEEAREWMSEARLNGKKRCS